MYKIMLLIGLFHTAHAAVTPVQFLNVCATQGDGSCITMGKVAGSTIQATLRISTPAMTPSNPELFKAVAGAAPTLLILQPGDVSCFIGINPTTAAAVLYGQVPSPVNGLSWQCSVWIRTGGPAGQRTGQATTVSGQMQWP